MLLSAKYLLNHRTDFNRPVVYSRCSLNWVYTVLKPVLDSRFEFRCGFYIFCWTGLLLVLNEPLRVELVSHWFDAVLTHFRSTGVKPVLDEFGAGCTVVLESFTLIRGYISKRLDAHGGFILNGFTE